MTTSMRTEHRTRTITIPAGVMLRGDLTIPPTAQGIVVFAHGSGSSRLSPRNKGVAARLHTSGFATLLFDLLTSKEESVDERTGTLRFDVPLLADRLARVTDWLTSQAATRSLQIGYFGASTGAGGGGGGGAERPDVVRAVVSRGGRPDLAGSHLTRVKAPTLLLVGGDDTMVIEMNRSALSQLAAPTKQLVLVPGATHLFEEPGALERVAELAVAWFQRHLATTTERATDLTPNVH